MISSTLWQLIWFVLAGFLLGFVLSTLWEWLFFRRERLYIRDRRIIELESEVHLLRREAEMRRETNSVRRSAQSTEYRSPGVFLDSEQAEELSDMDGRSAVDSRTHVQNVVEVTHEASDPVQTTVTRDDLRAELRTRAAELSTPISRPHRHEQRERSISASSEAESSMPPTTGSPQFVMERSASETDMPDLLEAERDNYVPFDEEPFEEAGSSSQTRTVLAQSASATAVEEENSRYRQRDPLSEYPDNLSRIKGIGKVYMRRLYDAGIYTWHQVGECNSEQLRRIVDPPVSANVEEWPAQGRDLAKRFGRVGATYVGPRPDDLTRIRGIGVSSAQALYQAGLCTYAQLAQTTSSELAAIIPSSPSGDEIDYAAWVRAAGRLVADD